MAARKQALHPIKVEEMRQRIKTTLLIQKLENHALTSKLAPNFQEVEMTPDQVRAALGLLAKTIPDLKAVEMNANIQGQLIIQATPLDETL